MDDVARSARTVVLVGCGKMGTAMLRGWTAAGIASRYLVVDPAGIPAEIGAACDITWYSAAEGLPREVSLDAVVFAVKPQVVDAVLPGYRRWVCPETLFLSIVAGKTLAGLSRHLGSAAIVRTMPNTPAAIGRGITVACANPLVSLAQHHLCDCLLTAVGETAWVEDEALIDAVTAVSGSGPAYVFLLIEVLAAAGEAEGLPAPLALRLALSTVAGAGELARISEESPAQLRENVTSPGGTTRAALDVLMAVDGLESLIKRAVAAAAARSRELAS
ncbi:MAG TPA: pyrroline-5-carboxylate reductase, partial [Stellaceae bacterium]|nr:pyrroline-5-carboxylate reductase [Stellaceae bacterium]